VGLGFEVRNSRRPVVNTQIEKKFVQPDGMSVGTYNV
jgi:hypothetical protein